MSVCVCVWGGGGGGGREGGREGGRGEGGRKGGRGEGGREKGGGREGRERDHSPISPVLLKEPRLPRVVRLCRSFLLLLRPHFGTILGCEGSYCYLFHPLPQGTAVEGVVERITPDPVDIESNSEEYGL